MVKIKKLVEKHTKINKQKEVHFYSIVNGIDACPRGIASMNKAYKYKARSILKK